MIRRITELSMLLALSIILSIIESFVPTYVPGVKLGLANIIILIMIYMYTIKDAFVLLILRVMIVSLLLGSFMSVTFFMSVSGGLFAIITMVILKSLGFNVISTSISGAVMHGVGQILIAIILIAKESIYYLPVIMILSIFTGIFTGFITLRFMRIMEKKQEE